MKTWIAASLLLVASLHAAETRPVSAAEAAAVEAAAAYLERGPAAIQERLSADSPLRALPADEIEVRLGPHAGAAWELQTVVPALADKNAVFTISYPSGLDETVVFEMTPDRRIRGLRVLAEKSPLKPLFAGAVPAAAPVPVERRSNVPLVLALLAVLLATGGAFAMRARSRAASSRSPRSRCSRHSPSPSCAIRGLRRRRKSSPRKR
jgi:hypothetical protein